MKAVGYATPGPIDRADALIDFELDRPTPSGHDVLVQVQAISVNPVDYKVRQGRPAEHGVIAVIGWDAVGDESLVASRAAHQTPRQQRCR